MVVGGRGQRSQSAGDSVSCSWAVEQVREQVAAAVSRRPPLSPHVSSFSVMVFGSRADCCCVVVLAADTRFNKDTKLNKSTGSRPRPRHVHCLI